jgi:hypothetical protein
MTMTSIKGGIMSSFLGNLVPQPKQELPEDNHQTKKVVNRQVEFFRLPRFQHILDYLKKK